MNIASHAAASQVAEQRQSKGITHGVDVNVWDKLCQCLPPQEDRSHALSQQGEVRKQSRLHEQPVPQEHKLNRAGEHDVEATSRSLQNLLACHPQVPCVHHKIDICVPVETSRSFMTFKTHLKIVQEMQKDTQLYLFCSALIAHQSTLSPPPPALQ